MKHPPASLSACKRALHRCHRLPLEQRRPATHIGPPSPQHRLLVPARLLLQVLSYLEITFGFQLLAGYLRTYHNNTADLFSRCTAQEIPEEAAKRGFEIVDLSEEWRQSLDSCLRWRVPVLMGLDFAA